MLPTPSASARKAQLPSLVAAGNARAFGRAQLPRKRRAPQPNSPFLLSTLNTDVHIHPQTFTGAESL